MTKQKIYILHGWTYSTEKWNPFLAELKNNSIEPVMLEIPGLTAPLKEVWRIENYVDWLKKKLEKEDKKIILLGHSNGGRIALAFIAKYPEKVEKLFLIDSAGIYHKELAIRIKRLLFGILSKTGKRITKSPKIRKLFYKVVREHDYENANPVVRKTMQNLITVDLRSVLNEIIVPTIIVWGKEDKATPLKDGIIMHNQIKNSKLFIIDNAKHSPQFTHQQEVVTKILENIQ